jgi:hypothetical protein
MVCVRVCRCGCAGGVQIGNPKGMSGMDSCRQSVRIFLSLFLHLLMIENEMVIKVTIILMMTVTTMVNEETCCSEHFSDLI